VLRHLPLTPILVCAALLATTYFGYSTWKYVTHNYHLSDEEAAIRREIAELDQEHAQLVAVRDYLRSDEYVEYVARNVLGLVRPGETLVIVSSSAPPAPSPTPVPRLLQDGTEPWWKDLFVAPPLQPTPTAP
jgi:cell division protein FtsB